MTPSLFEACKKAVHVITSDGEILRAGQASMFVLEKIGYPAWLVRPFRLPPLIWLTEFGYRFVANHRGFLGKFLFTNYE